MSNDKFFSKSNVYPAIWTCIIGISAFVAGLLWKSINGPEEVVIINRNSLKDTTLTIVEVKPSKEYLEHLNDFAKESAIQQIKKEHPNKKDASIVTLALNISNAYKLKVDSFTTSFPNQTTLKNNDFISNASNHNTNNPKRPRYQFPAIVSGYTESKINSYASVSINSTEFSRKDRIVISLDFLKQDILSQITPLFIDIVEPKDNNSSVQIWSEQYQINGVNNTISFSADFKPGDYTLSIGFYKLSEMNSKFPLLYLRKYDIRIKK